MHQALKRDGYRCAVTCRCDYQSRVAGLVQLQDGEEEGFTEASHIIPEATNNYIDKDASKVLKMRSLSFPALTGS